MATEITKTNGATMKGKFVKEKLTTEQLDKEVSKCFAENNIPELGWF